jgi:hypothetical protein
LDPSGILRFPVSFGLIAAAIVGASIARPKRRPLVRDLTLLGIIGLAFAIAGAWVPIIGPRPALPLTLAALSAALLIGLGAEAAGTLLTRRQFGLSHIASVTATLLIGAQIFGTGAMLATRPHPGLVVGAGNLPGYFELDAEDGPFRVLWLDGTSRRPRFSVTGPEGVTMRDHLERSAGGGYDAAARAVEVMTGRAGSAAGRILGTLGIRYVVVRPTASEELAVAVGDQIELTLVSLVEGPPGLPPARVFRNAIDIRVAEPMRSPAWASVSSKDLDAAQGVEANPSTGDALQRPSPARYEGSAPKGTRALLLGEPFDSGWEARVGPERLTPYRSFGWATGFALPRALQTSQPVVIEWSGQVIHRFGLLLWLLLNLVLVGAWARGGAGTEELR